MIKLTTYQEKLRAFADYLDNHPVIAEKLSGFYEYPSEYIYVENWDEFQTVIGALNGYSKSGYGGTLEARHECRDLEGETWYRVRVSVSGVCELKPKVDVDGNPVMKAKRVYVDTGELEQEMEYSCPEIWSQ